MDIKIYTTLDNIKLTAFEKLILTVIKGVLYEYKHLQSEPYCKQPSIYSINVHIIQDSKLTCFKISGNTPTGIFDDVKKLITPFAMGFTVQGGFNEKTEETSIVLQRFEIKRETLNYFTTSGL